VPEIETNFEKFIFRDVGALNDVHQALLGVFLQIVDVLVLLHCVCALFDQRQVLRQYTADSQAHLLAEVLKVALTLCSMQGLILLSKVSSFGDVDDLFDEDTIEHADLLFVEVAISFFFVL
jgi:hypothetical protein